MLNNYICALDIGSSKLVAAVARIKKNQISEIFFETDSSCGIKEGSVEDSIELTACVGKLLKGLKSRSGIAIKSVYANISGQDIVTKHSRAIIPLAERGNKVITPSDVQKVNEQARILGSSLEEEIIHQIPYSYSIDSKGEISSPLGLYSHRLEADLYLVSARISAVQSLGRVISQAGFELKELFLSGMATSCAVFSKDFKSGLNILCDIGSDITEILIFKDGMLKSIEILRLGGFSLTRELSTSLKIPFDLAEDLKKAHASVGDFEHIDENKEILVKKDSLYRPIKQKLAVEVVTAKTRSICDQIKSAVEKVAPLNEIDNFSVCGRTVLLEGFLEMLEGVMGIPVKLGKITHPQLVSLVSRQEALSGRKYLTYLTCLGIICEAMQEDQLPQIFNNSQPTHNPLLKIINRAKEVYQEYF